MKFLFEISLNEMNHFQQCPKPNKMCLSEKATLQFKCFTLQALLNYLTSLTQLSYFVNQIEQICSILR
jgi:hypothetical protein